jgi:hypothetical protein
MARRTGGKIRALCGKPIEAIQALAQRNVRIETLSEYVLELEREEQMVSFDIKAGYRHFRLAPQMRDWFLFRYDGHFYR